MTHDEYVSFSHILYQTDAYEILLKDIPKQFY